MAGQTKQYAGIGSVVTLSSNISQGCQVCNGWLDGEKLDAAINHYIGHGWRLLHVGQETHPHHTDGSAWHSTVAVVGA